MRVVLAVLAMVAFFAGAVTLSQAESAEHEITGVILFLIAAVFISGAAVVESINLLRREINRQTPNK